MVNMVVSKTEKYSVSFTIENRSFGPDIKDIRQCVKCEVYEPEADTLVLIASGIAILNPLDQFDSRIGAHKALKSATWWMERANRKIMHDQLEAWYQ